MFLVSPKGVSYYEYKNNFINALTDRIGLSSPTEVNHYECKIRIHSTEDLREFPSPTGVNHYESLPIKP